MYFVVLIIDSGVKHIIPYTWVKEIGANWQKFVNQGLNKNQKYTVFYSENAGAFDEQNRPNVNYKLNFTNELKMFPEEGCYYGKLLKFYSKCFLK